MPPTIIMKGTLIRSYKSQNGNDVFVYGVTGTEKELSEFKSAQSDFYREDEQGRPLWFTTRSAGSSSDMIITSKGKVIADMSGYNSAASLAKQFGGNLGQELAKQAVAELLKNTAGATTNAPQVQSPSTNEDLGEI